MKITMVKNYENDKERNEKGDEQKYVGDDD